MRDSLENLFVLRPDIKGFSIHPTKVQSLLCGKLGPGFMRDIYHRNHGLEGSLFRYSKPSLNHILSLVLQVIIC